MKKLYIIFLVIVGVVVAGFVVNAYAPQYGINDGLVGYWTFDGRNTPWTSDTVGMALDSSGNINTGTLTNMSKSISYIRGKIHQALDFDGTNDHIVIADSSSLTVALTFTISYWVKFDVLSTTNVIYNSGEQINNWITQISTANKSTFSELGVADYASNTTLSNNVWYHITVVKNGDGASNLTFYLNGVNDGTASVGSVSTPSGSKNIGSITAGAFQTNGKIDDMRVYNRALSAQEVKMLYRQGLSGNPR